VKEEDGNVSLWGSEDREERWKREGWSPEEKDRVDDVAGEKETAAAICEG